LHPQQDTMQTLSDKGRIKICVDCHSDQRTNPNWTAQIADLVVIKDGSEADGSTANTLRARVTDAFGNTLAGQTVSVLGGNGATTAPTSSQGQTGRWRSVSPARRQESVWSPPASTAAARAGM
ncbi:Ig-like domain-containing protein, partial [Escherichia coli]